MVGGVYIARHHGYLNINMLTKMTGETESQSLLASVLPWNTEPMGLSALVICPTSEGIEREREREGGREGRSLKGRQGVTVL